MLNSYDIFFDGSCRGNGAIDGSSKSSIGIYSKDLGIKFSQRLVDGLTNNESEWTSLITLLELVKTKPKCHLVIHGDSNLVIQQIKGEWRVREKGLIPLYESAKVKIDELLSLGFTMEFLQVKREFNKMADELANKALDD